MPTNLVFKPKYPFAQLSWFSFSLACVTMGPQLTLLPTQTTFHLDPQTNQPTNHDVIMRYA